MIQQLEVDGVPTLLAPDSGPLRAGIAFRVGVADETLARRGVTHLLEHLVLAPLGLTDYHYNGTTAPYFTFFHTQGSAQDVSAFLGAVCHNLHHLPMQRLETEKEILRAEWGSRGSGALDSMPLWRYGARDHGLTSYQEFGLSMLTPDDLAAWAARYFTRENAVLWIAGDQVPAGLRLPLPGGVRQPVPAASSALPVTPAYFVDGSGCVGLDAVVRRRTAAGVFCGVLERSLFRSLRQEGGLSYAANTAYEPRGDGYATIRALADALPDKQDAVLGGFIDVLAALAVGRIEQTDLDATLAKSKEFLDSKDVDAARLPTQAVNLLVGQPILTVDEYRAELTAVTVADLHEVAKEMMGSALLQVPEGCTADWAGFAAAPNWSTDTVTGTAYPARNGASELRVGVDGVSHVGPGGPLTVRYAECAALLAWPDGARQLIGQDAIGLRIEPTLFELHPGAVRVIDTQVPADRRVNMPPRAPENIPQPEPIAPAATAATAASPVGAQAPAKLGCLAIGAMVVSGIGALLVGGFALLLTLGMLLEQDSDPEIWAVIVFTWIFTAVLILPIVLILARHRRHRRRTR